MLNPKEKAEELKKEYLFMFHDMGDQHSYFTIGDNIGFLAIKCALIAVKNEYNSLREQLFNLRACRVIESEKVYLARLDELIKQETEIKEEILKL